MEFSCFGQVKSEILSEFTLGAGGKAWKCRPGLQGKVAGREHLGVLHLEKVLKGLWM